MTRKKGTNNLTCFLEIIIIAFISIQNVASLGLVVLLCSVQDLNVLKIKFFHLFSSDVCGDVSFSNCYLKNFLFSYNSMKVRSHSSA